MPSASAMAASLPDCTISPRRRSPIFTLEFSGANMDEPSARPPPLRHAFSDTTNSRSRVSRPAVSSRNTISAVISFAMLAGGNGSSGAFSNSTAPESASTRIAWVACGLEALGLHRRSPREDAARVSKNAVRRPQRPRARREFMGGEKGIRAASRSGQRGERAIWAVVPPKSTPRLPQAQGIPLGPTT
jgi:hypothetical protein